MKGSKDYIAIAGIILVLIVLVIYFGFKKLDKQEETSAPALIPPVTLEKQNLATSTAIPKAGAAKPKGDYTKMILEYQGRIIQFDEECRAFPNKAVFSVGTKIMLDNRGSLGRDIVIGTHHSSILPYDFMIYTLNTAETLSISCGPLVNSATIIISQ